MTSANAQWLKNAEAAEMLGVSERTMKDWMTRPDTRAALGGIRYGKQHRIPRPENRRRLTERRDAQGKLYFQVEEMDGPDLEGWSSAARWRLKKLGIELRPVWERELQQIAKRNARHYLESCRLWVATTLKALERGDQTQNARDAALLLMQEARKVLDRLPRHQMEVNRRKSEFPAHLAARGFLEAEVNAIMEYWPEDKHFKQVHSALTLEELEPLRRRLDYAQAAHKLEQAGQKPTAELVRALLHDDIMAHINDTGEQLPGIVIKPKTPDELRRAIEADVWLQMHSATPRRSIETIDAQGRTSVRIEGQGANRIIDLRAPQDGLALRTFRRRHPFRKSPQRDIVTTVYRVRDGIPGADAVPSGGKTPVRDSSSEHHVAR
jgi:hypothetical protein